MKSHWLSVRVSLYNVTVISIQACECVAGECVAGECVAGHGEYVAAGECAGTCVCSW